MFQKSNNEAEKIKNKLTVSRSSLCYCISYWQVSIIEGMKSHNIKGAYLASNFLDSTKTLSVGLLHIVIIYLSPKLPLACIF